MLGGGPNLLRFHFSTSPAALIQFRAYDCNTKTVQVVKAARAMMNAPLHAGLFVFGAPWEGGSRWNFMLMPMEVRFPPDRASAGRVPLIECNSCVVRIKASEEVWSVIAGAGE